MNVRVLIAGAGPVGLCAAACLSAEGIPVTVFEAEAKLPRNLRASTFHPPTLDMLASFGAADHLINEGIKAPTFQFRDRIVGKLAEFDFGTLNDVSDHPFRVQCEQYKLNLYLADWLRSSGSAEINFDHRLIDFEQNADGVTATLSTSKGEKKVAGSWLIGAEGANSVVRQVLGIPFEGFTWDERFLVVSTPFDFGSVIRDLSLVNYYADPQEWFFLLKVPGLWRAMFPIDRAETDTEISDRGRINDRLQRIFSNSVPYSIKHTTLYRVHQRVAQRYRCGRIFIAGDAAHVNNPLGGMGMNGGIHDAFNLASKLAGVAKSELPISVVDLYEAERRSVALEYVNIHTIRNKQNLEARTTEEQKAFRSFLKHVSENPKETRKYLLRVSMISSLKGS